MTVNTELLLDKLYNLRGSDSDILKEMDRQKNKAEQTRDRTTEEKAKLQKDIANLLGISQQYYSEYENGKRTIPIQHLITLANYYNTSIDWLCGKTKDSKIQ